MTQTTGGISFRNNKIELSTDGINFTDASGFGNSIEPGGGERGIGKEFTWDGDTPIITAGKRDALELKVKVVYTEGASDPVEVVRAAYEAGSSLYVRWSPKGGTAGQFRYLTSAGLVKNPVYPGGEAKSSDPVLVEFSLTCATVTKSVI